MDDELELLLVNCTGTGCLRAPLFFHTETIKWRKVYVIPIILNNRTVKGLSIPTACNIRVVKDLSICVFRNNRFGEMSTDTYRPKQ